MASWLENLEDDWVSDVQSTTSDHSALSPGCLPPISTKNRSRIPAQPRKSFLPRPISSKPQPLLKHINEAQPENTVSTMETATFRSKSIHHSAHPPELYSLDRSTTHDDISTQRRTTVKRNIASDIALLVDNNHQDLFSPMGLENLFKPPSPIPKVAGLSNQHTVGSDDTILQSQIVFANLNQTRRSSEDPPDIREISNILSCLPSDFSDNQLYNNSIQVMEDDMVEDLDGEPLASSTVKRLGVKTHPAVSRVLPFTAVNYELSSDRLSEAASIETSSSIQLQEFSDISGKTGLMDICDGDLRYLPDHNETIPRSSVASESLTSSEAKETSESFLLREGEEEERETFEEEDEEEDDEEEVKEIGNVTPIKNRLEITRAVSPIKIFSSHYDTYTRTTLQERMVQLDSANASQYSKATSSNESEEKISKLPSKRTLPGTLEASHNCARECEIRCKISGHFVQHTLHPISPSKESQPKRQRLCNEQRLSNTSKEEQAMKKGTLQLKPKIDFCSAKELQFLASSPKLSTWTTKKQVEKCSDNATPVLPIPSYEALKVILAAKVGHIMPKEVGGMIYDEHSLKWRRRLDMKSQVDNLSCEPIPAVTCAVYAKDADDDPFDEISDLSTSMTAATKLQILKEGSPGANLPSTSVENLELVIETSNVELLQTRRTKSGDLWGRNQLDLTKVPNDNISKCLSTGFGIFLPAADDTTDKRELRLTSQTSTSPETELSFISDHRDDLNQEIDDTEEMDSGYSTQRYGKNGLTQSNSRLAIQSSPTGIRPGHQNRKSISVLQSHVSPSHHDQRKTEFIVPCAMESGIAGTERNFYTPSRSVSQYMLAMNTNGSQNNGCLLSIKKSEISLYATPLNDITYHYLDNDSSAYHENFGSTSLGRGKLSRRKNQRRYPIVSRQIVKHLTDHDMFGPFWDQNMSLNLLHKGIKNIQDLAKFHPNLVEVNLEGNELTHLTSMPITVRDLKIAQNNLSSLTAWNHLVNLQFLDISYNDIDSLSGLSSLVHLRELKADNNFIRSLDGILHLNGLVKVRLRHNEITVVDFTSSSLKRLSTLDLKSNDIEKISGLHTLSELGCLNLDCNKLTELTIEKGAKMKTLRTLSLSQNHLEELDLSPYPNIRTLYIDENYLSDVHGIVNARHLDSFSSRSQKGCCKIPFQNLHETRKIYLSGNLIESLQIVYHFPNLQYLELASCKLQLLPKDLGKMMSNIRVLNLNNNAISDLKALYGILRLKRLTLVGNRIANLKKFSSMLKYLPLLSELDLRHNPLTLGFYGVLPRNAEIALRAENALDPSPFLIGKQDCEEDLHFQETMTEDTAVARRCYEILIGEHCSKLDVLDGLDFCSKDILRKDETWKRMATIGLLSNTVEQND